MSSQKDQMWLREASKSDSDKFLEASQNIKNAQEIALEAQKLKIFGGRQIKGGGALVGAEGLTLQTDFDLQSAELRWIVKNVIPDAGIGAIYGDSGTYKSFVALDLMAAISTGRDRWFGYRVAGAPCIYVPFEGKGGIPKRVAAWRLAMTMQAALKDPSAPIFPIDFGITTGIFFVTDPLNLRNVEDRKKLIELITANGLEGGVLCIDTLAQAGHGIDENSSEGMGEMISHLQELQRALGGVVLVVHHTGKDASKGMRGHSSLRGALDFAIEFSKPDSAARYEAQMRLDKVKDEEAGAVVPFWMQRVTLGVDDDGDHITSLVVVQPVDSHMPEAHKPPDSSMSDQNDADDEAFIYEWVKREVADGKFPSSNSLQGQLADMRPTRKMTQKRVRDAIHRLRARSLLVDGMGKSPSGNKWMRAVDSPEISQMQGV